MLCACQIRQVQCALYEGMSPPCARAAPWRLPGLVCRSATGKVREVRFFDKDVAQAHLTTQHLLATGPCRPAPNIQDIAKLGARR